MLPVHHLMNAILAESVSTLGDIRVIECLKADHTLCVLAYYFVHTDPNRFIES